MLTEPFNFARDLKISRFTIDVLMQRLAHVKPFLHCSPEELERFIGKTNESVMDCDHLHTDLCQRVFGGRSLGPMTSLNAEFAELHCKMTDSIADFNLFEFGTPRPS